MRELWLWSSVLNLVSAMAMIAFAVLLTEGAGFHSYPAALRLAQRIALCFMAFTMLICALHQINTRTISFEWFMFQIGFSVVWIVSALRHITSPAIPKDARWGRKVVTELKVQ